MEDQVARIAINARVTGRVQGVGFRFAVARRGRELGLTGWVRNTVDGSVEVWAQGDADTVKRFVGFLHVGPPAAHVDQVVVTPGVVNPSMVAFNVRY